MRTKLLPSSKTITVTRHVRRTLGTLKACGLKLNLDLKNDESCHGRPWEEKWIGMVGHPVVSSSVFLIIILHNNSSLWSAARMLTCHSNLHLMRPRHSWSPMTFGRQPLSSAQQPTSRFQKPIESSKGAPVAFGRTIADQATSSMVPQVDRMPGVWPGIEWALLARINRRYMKYIQVCQNP